ncbi:MlaD family protein, partial [Mycobacterium sp. E3247]|uniref:MlaD family protein n=2 Tax=unclassified Mycobacterium TaxID=2642494 RepID=UPI000ADC9138
MSNVFPLRHLRPRTVIGALVVLLAVVAGFVGLRLYQRLTTNTVVAYLPTANALYSGDKVQIMGVRVGAVDKIEPAGDKMKVTFHYENKYKVPANASAVIVNPTLVASR